MSDFHQGGTITTLHQLKSRDLVEIEKELESFNKKRPLALMLPSLYSELEGPGLPLIVSEISKVSYLSQVVVGLDQANEEQYRHALQFFGKMKQNPEVLWNDGPRLQKVDEMLQAKGLAPKQGGKGRNVWYLFGYLLATNRADCVASHDCDIRSYDRSLLARLIYPVAHPEFQYHFCKGYYSRITKDEMRGRVCRLLVTPFIRSLMGISGDQQEYLKYLDSFRYALAGEFSLTTEAIKNMCLTPDWGLEVGKLSEAYRLFSEEQICQVDIADRYEHKHRDLSSEGERKGLSQMSCDIVKSLFRKMVFLGVNLTPERVELVAVSYQKMALSLLRSYRQDAIFNGLEYSQKDEELAIEIFLKNVRQAGLEVLAEKESFEQGAMPSWKTVQSEIPDVFNILRRAVEEDQKQYSQLA